MQTAHISESTANGYTAALFTFARSSYEETGPGIVIIREGNLKRDPGGRVEANLQYAPVSTQGHLIPSEALEQVRDYNADKELVLAILSNDGHATVVTMGCK